MRMSPEDETNQMIGTSWGTGNRNGGDALRIVSDYNRVTLVRPVHRVSIKGDFSQTVSSNGI